MRGTLALLRLGLRQARASRLPALVAVQLLLVVAIVLLSPGPTSEARLRTAMGFALALAALIATVGGVAFAASLLPEERESRRIHRILGAPVGRGSPGVSAVLAAMAASFGLALLLAFASLPLIPLAGDAAARDAVLASTMRIRPTSVESAGEHREVEGLVWLYGRNPAVRWEVPIDAAKLEAGPVRGRIRIDRRLDQGGSAREMVPVGIRVEGEDEVIANLGPDRPVSFVISEEASRRGSLRVILRRIDESHVLGVKTDSLVLDGRRRSFLPEFALAAAGAGLVAALLAAIGAAVGSIASSGVAVAAALAVGFVGLLRGFLMTAARNLRFGIGYHGEAPEPTSLDLAAAGFVETMARLSPDLTTIGLGEPLRTGSTAGAAAVGAGLPYVAAVAAICATFAWLLVAAREYP